MRNGVWHAKGCGSSTFRLLDFAAVVGKAVHVTPTSGGENIATWLASDWTAIPRGNGKGSKVETIARRALFVRKAHVATRGVVCKEASVGLSGNDRANVARWASPRIASVLAQCRLEALIVVARTVNASNAIGTGVSIAMGSKGTASTWTSKSTVGAVSVSSRTWPVRTFSRCAIRVARARRTGRRV